MDEEPLVNLQAAPGAVVPQHRPYQLQPHLQRYLRTVVVVAQVRREQPGQAVALNGRLEAEVDHDQLRLTHDQPIYSGALREGSHDRQVGGLDRAVVTALVLPAHVSAVLIAIGRVVLRHPIRVRQLHTGNHPRPLRRAERSAQTRRVPAVRPRR